MIKFPFFKKKIINCLGIDIGTAVLKIVELSKKKQRLKLENYGLATPELKNIDTAFKTTDLSAEELADLIKRIIQKADLKTKKAVISLPIFSSFSVLVEMPIMPEKELAAAVPFEAKKYIPVPIEEVVLDWSVIESPDLSKTKSQAPRAEVQTGQSQAPQAEVQTGQEKFQEAKSLGKIQVLVVAVPKEIIDKYIKVAKLAGLELLSLEQESFSLARSLVGADPETYVLVDIGSRGSSVIIVENGFARLSYNLEKSDKEALCQEIERVVNLYKMKYNKNIKIGLMAGGVAKSDLVAFLPTCLNIEMTIGNPLAKIEYPSKLTKTLKELGPSLAVAVGLAMREL